MIKKQLDEDEKVFSVHIDISLSYSSDIVIAPDVESAKELSIEDAMENIELDVKVVELTLEDMDGNDDLRPLGKDGPTLKQLLEWKRQDEGFIPPMRDAPGQLFFWDDVKDKDES